MYRYLPCSMPQIGGERLDTIAVRCTGRGNPLSGEIVVVVGRWMYVSKRDCFAPRIVMCGLGSFASHTGGSRVTGAAGSGSFRRVRVDGRRWSRETWRHALSRRASQASIIEQSWWCQSHRSIGIDIYQSSTQDVIFRSNAIQKPITLRGAR